MKKNKALLRRALSILLSLMLLAAPALALDTAQAGELLQKYYIDSVSQEVLSQSTVEDMLSALGDPYTQYFDAQEYAAFLATMSDTRTGGVGVTSTMTDQGMVVETLTEGMPAREAGIQPGDAGSQAAMLNAIDTLEEDFNALKAVEAPEKYQAVQEEFNTAVDKALEGTAAFREMANNLGDGGDLTVVSDKLSEGQTKYEEFLELWQTAVNNLAEIAG